MAYSFSDICSQIRLISRAEMEELMHILSKQDATLTLELEQAYFCLSKVKCFLTRVIKIKHLTVV